LPEMRDAGRTVHAANPLEFLGTLAQQYKATQALGKPGQAAVGMEGLGGTPAQAGTGLYGEQSKILDQQKAARQAYIAQLLKKQGTGLDPLMGGL
jgi:hypothetical protein